LYEVSGILKISLVSNFQSRAAIESSGISFASHAGEPKALEIPKLT
jgi:hypothetical protein